MRRTPKHLSLALAACVAASAVATAGHAQAQVQGQAQVKAGAGTPATAAATARPQAAKIQARLSPAWREWARAQAATRPIPDTGQVAEAAREFRIAQGTPQVTLEDACLLVFSLIADQAAKDVRAAQSDAARLQEATERLDQAEAILADLLRQQAEASAP